MRMISIQKTGRWQPTKWQEVKELEQINFPFKTIFTETIDFAAQVQSPLLSHTSPLYEEKNTDRKCPAPYILALKPSFKLVFYVS